MRTTITILLLALVLQPLAAQDAEQLSRDIQRASASLSAGNHSTAAAILEHVIEQKPDIGLAWYQLALARRGLGKEADGFRAAEEAARLMPESQDAKLLLAEFCAAGDAARAGRIATDVLATGTEDQQVLRRLLGILITAHDARVPQLFERLLRASPKDPELLQQKVVWAFENHDLPAAIAALQAQVALEPQNPLPLQSLANAQFAAGAKDAAIATLEKLLAINPSNCGAREKVIAMLRQSDGPSVRVQEHQKLLAFYRRQTARWQQQGRTDTSPTTQPPPPPPRK